VCNGLFPTSRSASIVNGQYDQNVCTVVAVTVITIAVGVVIVVVLLSEYIIHKAVRVE
jgi:hypothetical protein